MGQKVLVVGGGGREHALAWALARSETVIQVFVAPGNAGTVWQKTDGRAESANVPIAEEDIVGLLAFALEQKIDLTVIGPEVPLSMGIVDTFQQHGLAIFGPTRAAAQLEASKAFSKAFMRQHGIPTAEYGTFTDYEEASAFVRASGGPVVVKADGLAAGKGVVVCDTEKQADAALRRILLDGEFGAAGVQVIVEERMIGTEVSALAFCDGKSVAMMPFARDHKRINDNDQGPNTGGMGAYAPVTDVPDGLADTVMEHVLLPAVRGMADAGNRYVGVLYAGLMLTPQGVMVLEFNCRFGDPETQAILPLLRSDLAAVLSTCIAGRLEDCSPEWATGACASVVVASQGYPGSYPKGLSISGLDKAEAGAIVFHAGTAMQNGQIVTAGGRVLAVSACGKSLSEALTHAYSGVDAIHFDGMHFRRDIGGIHEGIAQ